MAKQNSSSSIYDLVINDIKSSKEFLEFKKKIGATCDIFEVAKSEYHLCELNVHFENDGIKALKDKCKDMDLSTISTEKNDLNRFSDEGTPCFKVYFSEKIENKIIVELIQKSAENNLGYENLNFLYEIKSASVIDKMEVGGMVIN